MSAVKLCLFLSGFKYGESDSFLRRLPENSQTSAKLGAFGDFGACQSLGTVHPLRTNVGFPFHSVSQGIDINHKYDRKVRRTEPKSQDVYLRLLVKVSSFGCCSSIRVNEWRLRGGADSVNGPVKQTRFWQGRNSSLPQWRPIVDLLCCVYVCIR